MGVTYAIGDLHGRFDLLNAAIGAIDRHARQPCKIVFLGDYVDRGPESRRVVERLMAGPPIGWQWVCLKGNHEAMMIEALTMEQLPDFWERNGGGATLRSYGHSSLSVAIAKIVPEAHVAWLRSLPLMHVDRHRIYVHAGVDQTAPLDRRREEIVLWKRHPESDDRGHGRLHVVHGHDPFEDGPVLLANRTDLDALAWVPGRVVVGVFEDHKSEEPIDILEVSL